MNYHEQDLRLAVRLVYRDVHGHYPNFDVNIMNVPDLNEKYQSSWMMYKDKVVREAYDAMQ